MKVQPCTLPEIVFLTFVQPCTLPEIVFSRFMQPCTLPEIVFSMFMQPCTLPEIVFFDVHAALHPARNCLFDVRAALHLAKSMLSVDDVNVMASKKPDTIAPGFLANRSYILNGVDLTKIRKSLMASGAPSSIRGMRWKPVMVCSFWRSMTRWWGKGTPLLVLQ